MIAVSDLLVFTAGELLNAVAALRLKPSSTRKSDLMDALIKSGATMPQIVAASVASTPSAVSGKVSDSVDAAVAKINAAVNQQVLDVEVRLRSQISAVRTDIQSAVDQATMGLKAPVLPDLSGDVAAAVAAAFAPIRSALQAAPVAVQQMAIAAAPRQRKTIREVFGVDVDGDCEVCGPAYEVDVDYVWKASHLKLALRALETGNNFWLFGERGTGKTQMAQQLAARLGRPFFRVSFDSTTEKSEFVGADGLKGGDTQWQDGQVMQAYRTPDAICLLDECSAVRPEYATVLHAILEKNSRYAITSTGEVVQRAAGMCFIAADNTNGCGDSTGRYAGTRAQNSALVDRFALSLRVTFLPEKQEIALLVKRGAKPEVAKSLVNVFTRCRQEVGGLLVEPPSLRAAFAFCEVADIVTPVEAWEVCVVNKSPDESAEALRQLFTAHWK